MFKTFVWVLGDVPYLCIDLDDPDHATEMDVIGLSCMQHDFVLKPPVHKLDVKLIHPSANFAFKMTSSTGITVFDFVEVVNSQAKVLLDVKTNDILVHEVHVKNGQIVILTQTSSRELN